MPSSDLAPADTSCAHSARRAWCAQGCRILPLVRVPNPVEMSIRIAVRAIMDPRQLAAYQRAHRKNARALLADAPRASVEGVSAAVPNPQRVKVVGQRLEGDPRPSRAMRCAGCGKALEWLPGGAWTAANGPGLTGRNAECAARPTDDGYGPHDPGTPIAHPPADTRPYVEERKTCPGMSQLAADYGGQAPCGSRDVHDQHPMVAAPNAGGVA